MKDTLSFKSHSQSLFSTAHRHCCRNHCCKIPLSHYSEYSISLTNKSNKLNINRFFYFNSCLSCQSFPWQPLILHLSDLQQSFFQFRFCCVYVFEFFFHFKSLNNPNLWPLCRLAYLFWAWCSTNEQFVNAFKSSSIQISFHISWINYILWTNIEDWSSIDV
jgi:hypothetical protein